MSQDKSNSPPKPQSPSVFQAQSVKLLRGIIRVSENAIAQIESPPSADPKNNFTQVRQLWSQVLAPIRFLLPRKLSTKLSDLGLTSIIAGLLVAVIGATTLFSSPPPQIATVPPQPTPVVTTPEPEPTITTPSELVAPAEESKPIEVIPTPEIEVTPTPEIAATPTPEEVEPTPVPKVELTPEQSLIASIQAQITQVSDRISDSLIQSVQANFAGGSLVIQVKDDWYSLGQLAQDKLAQKLLNEAQKLDFTHLEITTPQGELLARSPVVGKNMIVFKRVAS
jgi:hypothetical protein